MCFPLEAYIKINSRSCRFQTFSCFSFDEGTIFNTFYIIILLSLIFLLWRKVQEIKEDLNCLSCPHRNQISSTRWNINQLGWLFLPLPPAIFCISSLPGCGLGEIQKSCCITRKVLLGIFLTTQDKIIIIKKNLKKSCFHDHFKLDLE